MKGFGSVVLTAVLAWVGPVGARAESPATSALVMRVATTTVEPHQQNVTMKEFKNRVEQKLGGRLRVELYSGGQLGTVTQLMQGLLSGTVHAVLLPAGFFGGLAPGINVVDLPFFFDSSEDAFRILNSERGSPLNDYLQTKGLVPLAWLWGGDRYILSRFPIRRLEDLRGKKIRTFPTPVAQGEISAWGAVPTVMDTSEVPVALHNGTIDGVTSDITFFHSTKLYQAAKYLLLAPKGAVVNPFMVNRTWLEGLPPTVREVVSDTARDVVTGYSYEYVREYLRRIWDELGREGVLFVEPSPELLAQMHRLTGTVHEAYRRSSAEAPAIYDGLRAAMARQ